MAVRDRFCHDYDIVGHIFSIEHHRDTKLRSTEAYWQAANFSYSRTSVQFSKWPPGAVFHHENHIFGNIFWMKSHKGIILGSSEAYWQAANFGYFRKSIRFSRWPPETDFHHDFNIFGHIFSIEHHRDTKLRSTEVYWQVANFGFLRKFIQF
jgi:hypothetical protein